MHQSTLKIAQRLPSFILTYIDWQQHRHFTNSRKPKEKRSLFRLTEKVTAGN
ncbi:Hypothetical protein LOCK908_2291 [Lacticaseibacillus rhamnosus LOCK908]|jgi:hypothetical protein|uniref:Uncharacterized protein n=2 Tax=Lacticaseibacillus rhamnosus TaxID=47715 RepID=C2JZ94_LACRM|nr:conserved hypothetical protein [Lacticaseibacillus rhamnosus ATCC 8530]AGP71988.1 Hypothetical protein LOCK900_2197 [Lacticaseibacillus rhamnosus LOCK900]AGP74912.1 Hypothetical protein LOCK908_2291 [Lacticaseibacillus rhamnosus LOCK908]ASY48156.1 hypothetical protein N507_0972 [Lacticaseibacillus rhamnosus DSM 14870]EEN79634.1 hypothetical protein HMPREF0539_2229 [Lacticaseibacillus rhamnosus LMS2-1]EHJ26588.1 hypothetical protein HMPREF0541_02754 [Lacticaseibacillus rhamnosus ATCC 21052]